MSIIYFAKPKEHNRLNEESNMRIQLSSNKPNTKEISKNIVKQCYYSQWHSSVLEDF